MDPEDCDELPNNVSQFSPIMNSTLEDQSRREDEEESAASVQYITDRLIRKIAKQENLHFIERLDLTLSSREGYIKKIKYIENLETLVNLRHLSLANNVIEKIENLEHLKQLRVLILSRNMIKKLENLGALQNLEVLNISHNKLERLPYKVLRHLQRLKVLDVSYNNIEETKQVKDLRDLGNLVELNFLNNPVIVQSPHVVDIAVFYLRGLVKLNGKQVTEAMRAAADKRLHQDEVNVLNDEIRGKVKMIDAVSKERQEVLKTLEEKKKIEDKLRVSGNTSMLRIVELEEELDNTKKLLAEQTEQLTAACHKHYALEQELAMYKVDVRFRDLGPPPNSYDSSEHKYVEESGYVSKAPLHPVQYGVNPGDTVRSGEAYREFEYSEDLSHDNELNVLQQQLADNERERNKLEKMLDDLKKEIQDKEEEMNKKRQTLEDLEKQLADEIKAREDLEAELALRDQELDKLQDVEQRRREAEEEVDDLRRAVQEKSDEVKDLRNRLALVRSNNGPEVDHLQARLKKKEDELEKHKNAAKDWESKCRELDKELSKLKKLYDDAQKQRAEWKEGDVEKAALMDQIEQLKEQLYVTEVELEDKIMLEKELQTDLDEVKQTEAQLRNDMTVIEKEFANKQTETEVLEKTLEVLEEENRRLKGDTRRLLEAGTTPEFDILNRTLDMLERAEAENERLARENAMSRGSERLLSPDALRKSRNKIDELEAENEELRDMLRDAARPSSERDADPTGGEFDPDELAKRILKFLEDRLPKYGDIPRETSDMMPIIKLLLDERDRNRQDSASDHKDLIKLLEELIKDKNNRSQQIPPVINLSVPEQGSPRTQRNTSPMLSERYISSPTPITNSRHRTKYVIHNEEEEEESVTSPDVIHVVSRKSQTQNTKHVVDIDVTQYRTTPKKQKQKRIIIRDNSTEESEDGDIIILDKRARDQITTTEIHHITDDVVSKLERSILQREGNERNRDNADRNQLKIEELMEEIRAIKQGLREAATQTNSNLILDDVQRRIDNALTRTNSLVSCGHEEQITSLRTNLVSAEREIDRLRDLVRDQNDGHEMYLTEMKIDNLGETIKDTNRSMIQNLHEVVREVVSRDSNKTSRDTARDNDNEIREIQKTLLDMQYSLKNVAEKQENRDSKESLATVHNTACNHCDNCKKKPVDLDSEIKKMREELLETFKLNTEKGSLDKVRTDHSSLLVEIERLKIERDTLAEKLARGKTQLDDVEHERRSRYNELIQLQDRVVEAERALSDIKTTETTVIDNLRREESSLRQVIAELDRKRDQISYEIAETQKGLQKEMEAAEKERKDRLNVLDDISSTQANFRLRKVEDIDRELDEKREELRRLKENEEHLKHQIENTKNNLQNQFQTKSDDIKRQEDKLQQLSLQMDSMADKKRTAEFELANVNQDLRKYKEELFNLENDVANMKREKQTTDSDIRSASQKHKQLQTRVSTLKSELDTLSRNKESNKDEIERQKSQLASLASEIGQLQNEKQSCKSEVRKLEDEQEALTRGNSDRQREFDALVHRKKEVEGDIRHLKGTQSDLQNKVNMIKDDLSASSKAKESELLKLNDLKHNVETIKARHGQLQDTFAMEESKLQEQVRNLNDQKSSLENTLHSLQIQISETEREVKSKRDAIGRLKEDEEKCKAVIAELEISKSKAANELDEHLNSAIKDKYTLSTEINALKRESDQLKDVYQTVSDDVKKLRSEEAKLRENVRSGQAVCEQLQLTNSNAEKQYKEYCNLAEQATQQLKNVERNIVSMERELQSKRSELKDMTLKHDECSDLLQDRQDKLHTVEKKLLAYTQRLNQSKGVLEENQATVSKLSNQKLELESRVDELNSEMAKLEKEKVYCEDDMSGRRKALESLRKDLEQCQKQHRQEMLKYNKLIKEKAKYDNEIKNAKGQYENYSKTLRQLKEEERDVNDKLSRMSHDLKRVAEEYDIKSKNLKNVEESRKATQDMLDREFADLRKQCGDLDGNIKEKSAILSEYEGKINEFEQIKEGAVRKEALLKEAETLNVNLQAQIDEITKNALEKSESDSAKLETLKGNLRKLKKVVKNQMNITTTLKKELVDHVAIAKTLELELAAQRDAHNSVISTLEEDNAALHSKCEEQMLDIETLRLELAIATQNLDAKQAELTMVADDVFNKTLNEDTDNRHSMLGTKDEIRNELMLSLSEMNRNKRDIITELETLRSPIKSYDSIPTRDFGLTTDRKILENINYKLGCIENTLQKDSTYQNSLQNIHDDNVFSNGNMKRHLRQSSMSSMDMTAPKESAKSATYRQRRSSDGELRYLRDSLDPQPDSMYMSDPSFRNGKSIDPHKTPDVYNEHALSDENDHDWFNT